MANEGGELMLGFFPRANYFFLDHLLHFVVQFLVKYGQFGFNLNRSLEEVDEVSQTGGHENSNNLLVTVDLSPTHMIDEKHRATCFRGDS